MLFRSRAVIDSAEPLLIYNADTYIVSSISHVLRTPDQAPDGVISAFEAEAPHFSYARVDESGYVQETAEKRRISSWATTGMYYFRSGAAFVRAADAMIAAEERVHGEFFVAPVYNRIIADGARVVLDIATEVWSLGTPDELRRFESHRLASREKGQ